VLTPYRFAIQALGNYTNIDFRIVQITRTGEVVNLRWRAPKGPTYQVEYTEDFTSWSDIPFAYTNIPSGTNNVASNSYFFTWADIRTPRDPYGMYRVRIGEWNPSGELTVLGLDGSVITHGETTPSLLQGTDYGTVSIVEPITNCFTLTNSAITDLSISSVDLRGDGALAFSVESFTGLMTSGATGSLNISFHPYVARVYTAVVEIANSSLTPVYTFSLQGEGNYSNVTIMITNIFRASGDTHLQWQAPYGPLYQVESSRDLQTWGDIPLAFTNIPFGTNSVVSNSYAYTWHAPTPLYYLETYRIRIADADEFFYIIAFDLYPTGQYFNMQWLGSNGASYRVEYTTNMSTWFTNAAVISAPVTTRQSVPVFEYHVPWTNDPTRSYRVSEQ